MKRLRICFLVFILFGPYLLGCSPQRKDYRVPLFDNMGAYQVEITTPSAEASKFFTQGIIMANAFNHGEAARDFREAIRLDSTCAMAYWGLAYVLGPNYNTNSNQGDREVIRQALDNALFFSKYVQPWEQALIRALAAKFPVDKEAADEEAFATAMREVYNRFPEDEFVVTLFAESLMNLHAWDFYTKKGGAPKAWTSEIVAVLEKAMLLNPGNPLANHLYIHAVEASADAGKGLQSAERLKTLVPGAGHLVHMPSHIYINTGQYHEGSLANEQAVRVDSLYVAQCKAEGVYPQLYYPHNYHFLAATATLEGRGVRAIEAAFKMTEIVNRAYLGKAGYETTQHYITIPYNVLVKFAQWEKILALPGPDVALPYPRAMWHYARGMAWANMGRVDRAAQELDSLTALAATASVQQLMIWEINSAADVVQLAIYELRAELALIENAYNEAVENLKQAVALEDGLNYNEPPDWFFSVRHMLGDVYMRMGEYIMAERVYREDLLTFPRNGFALHGLYYSLDRQGKRIEAQQVLKVFEEAWKHADSSLEFSRIDPARRKNLAIRLNTDSANDLVYMAGSFCR